MTVRFPFGKKTVKFPYDPNKLVDDIINFVDRIGKVRQKVNTHERNFLSMAWEEGDLYLSFIVDMVNDSAGRVQVRAHYRDNEVLQLTGNWIGHACGTKVELYFPGIWEKLPPINSDSCKGCTDCGCK